MSRPALRSTARDAQVDDADAAAALEFVGEGGWAAEAPGARASERAAAAEAVARKRAEEEKAARDAYTPAPKSTPRRSPFGLTRVSSFLRGWTARRERASVQMSRRHAEAAKRAARKAKDAVDVSARMDDAKREASEKPVSEQMRDWGDMAKAKMGGNVAETFWKMADAVAEAEADAAAKEAAAGDAPPGSGLLHEVRVEARDNRGAEARGGPDDRAGDRPAKRDEADRADDAAAGAPPARFRASSAADQLEAEAEALRAAEETLAMAAGVPEEKGDGS